MSSSAVVNIGSGGNELPQQQSSRGRKEMKKTKAESLYNGSVLVHARFPPDVYV